MHRKQDHGLAIFMGGIVFGVVLISFAIIGMKIRPGWADGGGMSYSDLSAVLLGAVAVLVTVLGVFVAILAIWGYAQFGEMAKSAALNHVESELTGGNLRQELEQLLINFVTKKIEEPDGVIRKILAEQADRARMQDAERRAKRTVGDSLANENSEYGD